MFSYTQNNPVNAIDLDGEETTGEFLNNWAKGVVFDDVRNNRSGARGVAAVLVSSTWDAFGFESLSKVADNSINGRDDMATSDYVWATVEVGSAGVGKAFKSVKKVYNAFKYRKIGSTGTVGEKALSKMGGEPHVFFSTSDGARFVDRLVGGVAHESKVGYTSLTASIRRQIGKDVELLSKGKIEGAVWHFYKSPVTGKVGASQKLLNELRNHNITPVIHK